MQAPVGRLRLDLRIPGSRDAVTRVMWSRLKTDSRSWSASAPRWHGAKERNEVRWWWRLSSVDLGARTEEDFVEFGETDESHPEVVVPALAAVREIRDSVMRTTAALAVCAVAVLS